MFNKVLVAGGVLFGSILIVENYVIGSFVYVGMASTSGGTLAIVSIGIGMAMGYGARGLLSSKSTNEYDDENLDF